MNKHLDQIQSIFLFSQTFINSQHDHCINSYFKLHELTLKFQRTCLKISSTIQHVYWNMSKQKIASFSLVANDNKFTHGKQ